jgi:PAS domain S-box-containing protein
MSWLSTGRAALLESAATAVSPAADLTAGLLEFVNDGVVVLDAAGQITHLNARAAAILHASLTGLKGQSFWEAVPEEVAEQHQEATRQALKSSDQHAFVFNDRFEDSWLEYCMRRHSTGYVVSIRDVAQIHTLKRLLDGNERYNQLVFETNPNVMWLFDSNTRRILAVNEAAVHFYGIARKQFLKLNAGTLFPDGEGAILMRTLENRDAGRHSHIDPQLCKQQKMDGTLVLVELAFGHVSWRGQHAVLASITDVSDRHLADRTLRRENIEMEQQLEAVKTELASSNRDMAAFTHALSNDLQAPLHATNGFAGMLADKYAAVLDGPGQHYLSRIQASTRQLARLVDDLRRLVQLPPVSMVLETVDLAPLCRHILADLRKKEPGRLVTVEMDAHLPLLCDPNLVCTALAALLENAWKFTGRKTEAWIKVEIKPGQVAHERVLRVTDNGAGFDPAYVNKLFTPFQRLHSSADFAGHGLGLGIVKRVALRHGGRVWAESTDSGASFFMGFPQPLATNAGPNTAGLQPERPERPERPDRAQTDFRRC